MKYDVCRHTSKKSDFDCLQSLAATATTSAAAAAAAAAAQWMEKISDLVPVRLMMM